MAKKPTQNHYAIALAALTVDLGSIESPTSFRLIPAGEFRARDGRPAECAAWVCTSDDGHRIVAELSAQSDAAVIDYEHATLRSRETGEKAPAAGWFKSAEWRDDGLWLVDVTWTAAAAQMIASQEYRYISPVFSYDQKTGRVLKVRMAALTNYAGLDGLTDLAALAAEVFDTTNPETSMNEELMEQLCWMLNMPVGSTVDDVLAQLKKITDQLKAGSEATAANGFDLEAYLQNANEQIAALTASVEAPNPEKFVPMAMFIEQRTANAELTAQIAELSVGQNEVKLNGVIEDALATGKITPAQESYARQLGSQNMAALTAFIDAAVPVVVPGKSQTDAVVSSQDPAAALSAQTLELARIGGWDPVVFKNKE